jgi:signal transduction histidine kinase
MAKNQTNKNYPIKDIEVFFEYILNMNLEIENNIFRKLTFKDPSLEKKYEEFEIKNVDFKTKRIFSDFILILGNVVSIIYVCIFLMKFEMIILFSVNLLLSILITLICLYKKIKKTGHFLDHLNVFINNSSLVIKAILVIFTYSEEFEDDKLNIEMLRIIIYHFLFVNLVICFKFNASFYIYTIYFIFNLIITILAIIYSKKDRSSFEFEAFISFGFTYLIFTFRKIFENLSRKIYSEKYKFEKLYNYTTNLIKGLEHNYIVLRNDKTVFINEKFSQSLENEEIIQIINNNNNYLNTDNYQDKHAKTKSNFYNSSIELNKLNRNFNYEDILKKLILIEDENNNYSIGELNKSHKILNDLKENNLWKMIKEIEEKNLIKTNNFFQLGIFKFDIKKLNIFYLILIRKHDSDIDSCFYSDLKKESYLDLIFLDVSDLLLMKKKILEENLIKERVIAKLTHELKTPINSIMGLINILSEKKAFNDNMNFDNKIIKTSSIKSICEMKSICSLSNYTLYLVNDIIQYSSTKSRINQKVNKEPINLLELIEFCYDILESLLNSNKSKKENIKSILDLDPIIHRIIIYSDEIRLKQILLNLVSNSVKFCRSGEIILRCKYDKDNNQVIITVKDTGIGIKKDDLKTLFNDFVMLEDGNNLNKQGSGLGLSICKTLTNLLEIDLKFSSTYGIGTEAELNIQISEIQESEFSSFYIDKYNDQIPEELSK